MTFAEITSLNVAWMILMVAGTIELLVKKRLFPLTAWLVIGANFAAGVANISSLYMVLLGTAQLVVFLVTYAKRDTLTR